MKNNRPDIVYIVSHGFAARMVVQTGLLENLVKRGLHIGLISPDAGDENLRAVSHKSGIKLYQFERVGSFWYGEYMTFRTYVHEDVKKNTALWEKHLLSKKVKSRNPWRWIRPGVFLTAHKLVKAIPALKEAFKNLETRILNSGSARKLLEDIRPRLIVSTYPVAITEAVLLHNARKMGIRTAIHLLSWDNITCKGHFPALADEYIAWGPIMKEELEEYYGISEEKIHVCGVPHFDLHHQTKTNPAFEEYIQKLKLKPSDPYLFFAMSSPRFAPREIDIVEWLAKKVSKDGFGESMQLIVRPHPQNVIGSMADTSWLPRLEAIRGGKVAVDYPELCQSRLLWSMKMEDMQRMSQLLHGASVCINSGSTMSIDALMVDTPVVLSSFDGEEHLPYWTSARRLLDFPHLKKFVGQGGIPVAGSFYELQQQILQFINLPDYLKTEREYSRYKQCGENDGAATQKVVKTLDNGLLN